MRKGQQITKPPRQYRPNSATARYRDGLHLQTRKRNYLYWYKFLRYAEENPKLKVDWKKYSSWGGKKKVMNTRFDEWWEIYWKKLFGYEKGKTPKIKLNKNPQADAVRYALLTYEYRNAGSKWDIAVKMQKREKTKRIEIAPFSYFDGGEIYADITSPDFNTKTRLVKGNQTTRIENYEGGRWSGKGANVKIIKETDYSDNYYRDDNDENYIRREFKRRIQGYISKYQKDAKKIFQNVCNGTFP